MKTATRFAALGCTALILGLAGCGEDNDKAAVTDPTGKPLTGYASPDAPKTSGEAHERTTQDVQAKFGKDYKGK